MANSNWIRSNRQERWATSVSRHSPSGRGPAGVAVQVWRGFGVVDVILCIFYTTRVRGPLYGLKVYSVSCCNYAYISQFLDLSRKCQNGGH